MVKVQQFLDWINAFAPFDSAEDFDNVGLLMGDRQAEVHAVPQVLLNVLAEVLQRNRTNRVKIHIESNLF